VPIIGGERNMRGVTIRNAQESDFDAIAELTTRVFIGEGFSEPEAEARLSDVRSRAASADLLLATGPTGKLLGSVCLVWDGPLRQIGTADELEVRLLCVEPSARRQGVAQALVEACVSRAVEGRRVRVVLSTQPTMYAAQQLYERLGFQRSPDRDWKRKSGRPMLAYTLNLQ
jgi:ribosomal protein S18 acetylase RimI-like enzyme